MRLTSRLWAPVLLGLLVAAVFRPVLMGKAVLSGADPAMGQMPFHHFMADRFAAGEAPLWNPYSFGGDPLHASDAIHVFYPLSHVFNFLDARWAISLKGELVVSGRPALYRNRDVLPRAFVVEETRGFDDPDRLLAAMRDPGFDPREAVLLECSPPDPVESAGPAPVGVEGPAVEVLHRRAREVAFSATLPRPGYLVLADSHYPGWTVTVDGRPAYLLRAYYALRAVRLGAAGRHLVEMAYNPSSFTLDLGLTFALIAARRGTAVRPRTVRVRAAGDLRELDRCVDAARTGRTNR